MLQTDAELQMQVSAAVDDEDQVTGVELINMTCNPPLRVTVAQMAVSGANLHNVFMLLTLEAHLARNPYLVLHVRRNHLVSDTLRELTSYSDVDLKKPLKVRRVETDGPSWLNLICVLNRLLGPSFLQVIFDEEEAVDAGGVTKEFFLLLLKELMDPVYGMFTHYKESNLLWFSDKVCLYLSLFKSYFLLIYHFYMYVWILC